MTARTPACEDADAISARIAELRAERTAAMNAGDDRAAFPRCDACEGFGLCFEAGNCRLAG